jgi:hypothetical protein
MAMAMVGHAASHGAASQVIPQGHSDQEQQILLLLVLAAVIIFIQTENSSKALDGQQFAALGVVGFILLVLAQFWPEVALTFTVLFVLSIILNSPNGVPVIGGSTAAGSGNVSYSGIPNVTNPTTPASTGKQVVTGYKVQPN